MPTLNSAQALAAPPPAAAPQRSQPVIVLIEDDRGTRQVLESLLTTLGYRVHATDRLAEGRALVATFLPDLLIVDGLLPDGLGTDLVNELRVAKEPVRILFLSSFFRDMRSHLRLQKTLEVDLLLHKPQSAPRLLEAVQSLVPLRDGRAK